MPRESRPATTLGPAIGWGLWLVDGCRQSSLNDGLPRQVDGGREVLTPNQREQVQQLAEARSR